MVAEKKSFTISSNGMDFYCERRGTTGEKILLYPAGSNDCEEYDRLAVRLADEFQTLTFDPRGAVRSPDPTECNPDAEMLAEDAAGILQELGWDNVTVFGCSSGGQASLMLGKLHPELVKNLIIHEAALQNETPLPGAGFTWFEHCNTFGPYLTDNYMALEVGFYGDAELMKEMGPEALERLRKNWIYWGQHYVGHADQATYSKEDFEKMPPVHFTLGVWTPAWLTLANIKTAERAGAPITWFHSAHYPDITCPDEYAAFMREEIHKY